MIVIDRESVKREREKDRDNERVSEYVEERKRQ